MTQYFFMPQYFECKQADIEYSYNMVSKQGRIQGGAQGARAPPPLKSQIDDFSNSTISYKINPPVLEHVRASTPLIFTHFLE